MEVAVADRGDRGRRGGAVGVGGDGEPGALGGQQAVEVLGAEEVVLGGLGAAHRLLVEVEEGGALGGARLVPGDQLDPVAGLQVAAHLPTV